MAGEQWSAGSRRGRSGRVAAVAAAAAVVVPLVALPLARAVSAAGPGGLSVWSRPDTVTPVVHTLALAVVVTLLAVPLGAATALALARPGMPLRRTLRVGALLPLVVPPFVLGAGWVDAYGPGGLTGAAVGWHWAGLFGPVGVAVVLVVTSAPLSVLVVTAALAGGRHAGLEQAARASGASGRAAARTVTLPLLRPALAAAAAVTFAATLESFAVPEVLGTPAGFATVTTRIYTDVALGADPATFRHALGLALGLAVAAAVVLLPADLLLPRLRRPAAPGTGAAGPPPPPRRPGRPAAALLAAVELLGVGLPTAALLATALTRAVGLAPTPGNWTLANFRAALSGPTAGELAHSLVLAAAAASLLGLLALAAAAGPPGLRRLLDGLATATFALPGSVLAVAMLAAYGRWLDGTLTLILLAYLAKLWALAARPVSALAEGRPAAELQAARVCGAGWLTARRTALLPALAPALLGGWLLVFATALHEVTMSSLLYSTGSETLAVAVLDSQQLGDLGQTAALSVLLTGVVLLAAAPGLLLLRRRPGPRRTAGPRRPLRGTPRAG